MQGLRLTRGLAVLGRDQAELEEIRRVLAGPPRPPEAPTTDRARDSNADFV